MRRINIYIFLLFLFLTLPLIAKERIKVACIGNSITYGTGIEDRLHDSYPAQLQQLMGEGYEIGNFGKPGATLLLKGHRPYMQQVEYRAAMDFGADIAVIHLGINDTDPRDWPNYRDDFIHDYMLLIDSLRSTNQKMRVLVARLTPIADRHPRFISGTKIWHVQIQEAIEEVAKLSGSELIDFHEPLYAYPFLLPDAIHPNPEGAGMLAKCVFSAITGNYGGLQLSPLFSDYMILQCNKILEIKGIANRGDKVTVCIAGQNVSTVANNQGKWQVRLNPLHPGEHYKLSIKTKEKKLEFKEVAVGEVWLCSGQSNMQFKLQQSVTGETDIPKAFDSGLRLYNMQARWATVDAPWPTSAIDSLNHLQYFKETTWQPSTPESAMNFSAVAYYYGKMLRDSLQVPVGLICNAIGGATTESWIDRNSLELYFPAILKNWIDNDFIQEWARGRAKVNLQLVNSEVCRHPYEPCYLYESGIAPLDRYPIKGVIWYQGESNAHNFEAHEELFKLLVKSWRKNWHEEIPFYYVQLSSIDRPSWPWFRDSQRRLMQQIPNTGMAVSSDKGDSLDVHPRHKQEIGERLARWSLNKTYHHLLVPSGPLFHSAERDGANVILKFDYANGLQSANGGEIIGFEMAEHDGLFYPAQAVKDGDMLRITSPKVKFPHYVRYGWQPFTRANLVNHDLLPASTFRIFIE